MFILLRKRFYAFTFPSDDNQADVIEAFKSTSRYLDALLNTDNPYFEGMANQLQLNKVNALDNEASFFVTIYLFLTILFHLKCVINTMTLILRH